MFWRKPLRKTTALVAAACLLWMQLALAAYACPGPGHATDVSTVAPVAEESQSHFMDDCCADPVPPQAGLCAVHCNPAELSLSHVQADAPPMVLVPLYPVALLPLAAEPPQSVAPPPLMSGRSPPLAIIYCCYRI